jgi:hypothetical protein
VANVNGCLTSPTPTDRAYAIGAGAAIVGGTAGAFAGVMLTRHYDDDTSSTSVPPSITPTLLPVRAPDGTTSTGVGVIGSF